MKLVDLIEKFKDEKDCLKYILKTKYNGKLSCPSCHTNNIEWFWNQLKRMIKWVYGTIGKKTLQSYVDEYIFRYNNRNNKKLMFEEII